MTDLIQSAFSPVEGAARQQTSWRLRCLRCGTYDEESGLRAYLCATCGAPAEDDAGILDVEYTSAASREMVRRLEVGMARQGISRWEPWLPISLGPIVGYPVGDVPLISAPRLATRFGLSQLLLKNETRNPTGALKDRATAIGVAIGSYLGYRDFYCASAGNAAISLAGFCANLGLGCHVFVPARTPSTRLETLRAFGAQVTVDPGDYDAAFAASEREGRRNGWYSRNSGYNPFLVEGKKTCAFEIAEELDWDVPDVVVAPVGDGCTLGALGKGFRQLFEARITRRVPKLMGVQVPSYDSVVRRYEGDPRRATGGETRAVSIAVGRPRNLIRVSREVTESGGHFCRVEEAAVAAARSLLATDAGIDCEFTSAASLAGIAANPIFQGKRVVLVITGGRVDPA